MNANRLGLALVFVCCCVPLFAGLGRGDLWGDEAAHSFSVDRMLEAGDWLVPKSSPHEDDAFLEKPPLKFWMVAAPIRLGILPHDEFGFRFWDAVFGALAFLYVYAIGRLLAGPVCGVVSVLTLFAFWPLLFDHGLRGNNMEAPLLLCYCGGMYHYLRAVSAEEQRRGTHAFAVALYFVLGFMTKFVAALFLPLVLGAATLLVPRYRRELARRWRLWAAAIALAIALIAPWFVYIQMRFGRQLWDVMFGANVYTRMTSYLDPAHAQPWPFYWISLYKSFSYAGALFLVAAGTILLLVQTIRRRWPEGLVVLLWGLMPLVLISFGTSKLMHYAYPFLPPFALGGGYLAAMIVMLAPAPLARIGWPRALMVVVAVVAALLVAETVRSGDAHLSLAGHILFRNSGVFRPAMIALVAAVLASRIRSAPRLAAALVAAALVPVPAYAQNLGRLDDGTAPLRTMRDCLERVETLEAKSDGSRAGLYVDISDAEMRHHIYYYFRSVRPWTRADSSAPVRIDAYSDNVARQRPMLVAASRYQTLVGDASPGGGRDLLAALPPAVVLDDVKVLLPGPYAACGPR